MEKIAGNIYTDKYNLFYMASVYTGGFDVSCVSVEDKSVVVGKKDVYQILWRLRDALQHVAPLIDLVIQFLSASEQNRLHVILPTKPVSMVKWSVESLLRSLGTVYVSADVINGRLSVIQGLPLPKHDHTLVLSLVVPDLQSGIGLEIVVHPMYNEVRLQGSCKTLDYLLVSHTVGVCGQTRMPLIITIRTGVEINNLMIDSSRDAVVVVDPGIRDYSYAHSVRPGSCSMSDSDIAKEYHDR